MSSSRKDLLREALAAHARGLFLTPLDGKKAFLPEWQKRPRQTEKELREWISKGYNIGLRTGPVSHMIVIDADVGSDVSPLDLPDTWTVVTGGGGRHYLYSINGSTPKIGNSCGKKLGPKIDVRGEGGQVVLAGSTHPGTGRVYEWAPGLSPDDMPIANLPPHIIERLTPRKRKNRPARLARTSHAYARKALDSEILAVKDAPEHEGNNQLNRSAFALGQLVGAGLLTNEEVTAALLDAATPRRSEVEARATIQSGLEAGKREPRSIPGRAVRRGQTPAPSEDNLPAVLIPGSYETDEGEYGEVGADDFVREVLKAIPEPAWFMRGGVLGEIIGDKFTTITEPRARAVIDQHVRLMLWKGTGNQVPERIYTPASRDHAGLVIASAGKAGNGPPTLTGITTSPTMRPDGSTLDKPGYDRTTGLYYDPLGVEFPKIPDRPSLEDAHAALVDLAAPFSEFCYVDQNLGLSVVVSAILTLIARGAIEGACPLFAINSTAAGSGKDLLLSAACIIGIGREPKRDTPPTGSRAAEEWRKMILTYAIEGHASIALCNIDQPLGSGPFDEALTGPCTSGRVLGFTRSAEAPLTIVWWAVGNNLRFVGDTARRVVPIDLDPRVEDPDKRTGPEPGKEWTHPDHELKAYVRRERPSLVSAGLTLLRGFHLARRPSHGRPPLGSFTEWDAFVRGAVIWAGGSDPLAGCESVRRESDADKEALRAALLCWHAAFCNQLYTAAEVISAAKDAPELLAALAELARCDAGKLDARRLGYALKRVRGRTVSGLRFVRGGRDYKAKIVRWRIEGEPE